MSWKSLSTADGSVTLVHPAHGEACHSRAGAWEEARERYARACGLPAFRRETLRLLDVGTGIGLNLAAALEATEGRGVRLRAVSLEIDRGVIEAGLSLDEPPEVLRWLAPVREALRIALAGAGQAALGRGSLTLLLGDARERIGDLHDEEIFDAVFLDPFSPRVEPGLWEPDFLRAIARHMAKGSRLSTYSASLGVRAGLRAAGLRVGPGARVGTKSSGTVASPDRDPGAFDERTRRRIERRAERLGKADGRGLPGDSCGPARLRADA